MPVATLPIIFVTSFAVGLSGAVSPGPLLVYDIRESLRRGFSAGPLIAAGHSILELIVVIGLAIGVARFLEADLTGSVIALLGGLFLLWMGWGMVRRPGRHIMPSGDELAPGEGSRGGPLSTVAGGALVSMSNPFWSLWWATIGLSYILWASDLGVTGLASFYTGHILADILWFSIVSFAVASGRRVLTPALYRGLISICGLFLLALGAYFIVSGAKLTQDFLA